MQANGIPANVEALAKAITAYRDNAAAPNPFKSLFDLNNVPAVTAAQVNKTGWDISNGGEQPITGDFEQKYELITRISNLATTRSDSFTVYLLVQGWRNAGTANPELVAQRRAAMIIDRSNVTPEPGSASPRRTSVLLK
jgi:hypothetical protein